MRKRFGVLAGIFLLVAGSLTGCRIGNTEFVLSQKKLDNKTLFMVDGQSCSVKEGNIYLYNYKNLYGNVYGMDLWEHGGQAQDLEEYVKDVTLDELSRIICMNILAKKQEVTLDEEEQKLVSQVAKQYYQSLSSEEISQMDIRLSDVENAYTHYALAEKLYQSMTNDVEGEVSDDEARIIHVQQIFVESESAAEQVAERLESGEDFYTVAVSFNETGSVERTIARGDYPKEVEDIAFNLENDSCSGQIQTEDGYYFIKCIDKFDQKLTEANKANILVNREKQQFEDAYEELMDTADFTLNETVWEQTTIIGQDSIATDSFFAMFDELWESR